MLKPEAAPRIIRVFVGSPQDVAPERAILLRVINEMNDTLETFELPLRLQFRGWERHTVPTAVSTGDDTQAEINRQIGDYEIFIGIMWTRFGTPTKKAGSGTEEEYDRAYELWVERGAPYIMFYFSKALAPPPDSPEDAEQLVRVSEFRKRITKQQYYAFYKGRRDFEAKIRQHLLLVLKKFWNDFREEERKKNEVIDAGKGGIREAVNNLLPSAAASPQMSQTERLSPETVNVLRAVVERAAAILAPPPPSTSPGVRERAEKGDR